MNHVTNLTISFPAWLSFSLITGFFALIGSIIVCVWYLAGLHYQLKSVCKEFPNIQQSLIRLSEILLQKKIVKERIYIASHSPVALTPAGKKAIAESKFQVFYEANKKTLIERVKKKNPKTMADLEEACKEVMLSAEDSLVAFDLLKQFSYNKGDAISNILFAGAIALRDILKKELKIKD